jgi:hypothetical protein
LKLPVFKRLTKTSPTLCAALSLTLLLQSSVGGLLYAQVSEGSTLKGGVIITDDAPKTPELNPNDLVEVGGNKGQALEMKLATLLGSGLSVEGDEFFGKISKDYTVDGKLVLPRGTLIHGIMEAVSDPKRMGRDGTMKMRFDYMITPDGREIPIEGKKDTAPSAVKSALQIAGRGTTYALGGGIIGALVVLQYGGLAAVTASSGYALAGGAAVGGVAGLTAAMLSKGQHAMLQPGAELKFKLTEPIQLPTMNPVANPDETRKLEGLTVQVLGQRIDKDPFGELKEITLTLDIDNSTEHSFSTFDMALLDEYGTVFYPTPFGDTGLWFGKVTPNSRTRGNLSFSVDDAKAQHYLVFYKQYSRQVIAKQPLKLTPQEELGHKRGKRKVAGRTGRYASAKDGQ